MSKTNRMRLTVGFIAFLLMVSTVWGLHTIWSNTVTDTVTEYTLVLTKDSAGGVRYSNFSLIAQLKLSGVPVNTAVIRFYKSLNNSTWTSLGTRNTDVYGNAVWIANRTEVGTIYYKASYDAA